jgi:hypothetical protein
MSHTFSIDQIQQLEIGRNGNILPRLRDLDQDSTLKGSLLRLLYPGIRVASVNVPVEPLEEIEETRVRNTMANFSYKGVRYKLVGASGSAKKGKFYFVDEQHHKPIATGCDHLFRDSGFQLQYRARNSECESVSRFGPQSWNE